VLTNGGWLMRGPFGAADYSTPDYSVQIDKWSPQYTVTFHHKHPRAVYIYSTFSGFKQLQNF
jgi:hypothetical protein